MTRSRPTIAIVGAGRVGQALGFLLRGRGYAIGSVVCRTASTARAAAAFIGGGTPRTVARLRALDGDVILIAAPDGAIEALASHLAKLPNEFRGRIVLHVSGAVASTALAALKARGAATASWHPLQSFATAELGASSVAGSTFAIEGDRAAATVASRLARDIGGRPVRLRAGSKALYHAAAVMASGHVTALLDASLEAMRAAGFSDEEARAAVLPLVEGTLANIRRKGTRGALTGPFARGDVATIERNRAALAAVSESIARLYDALGERSRALVKRG